MTILRTTTSWNARGACVRGGFGACGEANSSLRGGSCGCVTPACLARAGKRGGRICLAAKRRVVTRPSQGTIRALRGPRLGVGHRRLAVRRAAGSRPRSAAQRLRQAHALQSEARQVRAGECA